MILQVEAKRVQKRLSNTILIRCYYLLQGQLAERGVIPRRAEDPLDNGKGLAQMDGQGRPSDGQGHPLMLVNGEEQTDALRRPGLPASLLTICLIVQESQLLVQLPLSEHPVKVLLNVADRCLQLVEAVEQGAEPVRHAHRGGHEPGHVNCCPGFFAAVISAGGITVFVMQRFRICIMLAIQWNLSFALGPAT